ncbi:MAG: cation transporter [Actinobacteria bacterium]|nr:MAG: cation transporter [Actinomycetota bacterium]
MGYRRDTAVDGDRAGKVKVVLWVILFLNTAVAVAKVVYGMLSHSVAMQADGFHSLFDGVSNVVGLVGISLAARPADREHPYGHGKYETYASAAIGGMLVFAAVRVGTAAWQNLFGGGAGARVDAGSFAVMLGTLAVNVGVTTWERRVGKRLGSSILIADASHTGSDVMVSLGVIAGLVAVKLGYPIADPLIALAVAGAIVWTAIGVLRQAEETLSDRARLPVDEVVAAAMTVAGVLGCHSVRTRGSVAEVLVDLHCQVDPALSVSDAHAIAEAVERAVAEAFPQVVDVIVHHEPMDDYQRGKTRDEVRASGA